MLILQIALGVMLAQVGMHWMAQIVQWREHAWWSKRVRRLGEPQKGNFTDLKLLMALVGIIGCILFIAYLVSL